MKPALIVWLKQLPFYFLVVAPLLALDIWLVEPRSHVALYVVEAGAILGALMAQGPLQRRFWP